MWRVFLAVDPFHLAFVKSLVIFAEMTAVVGGAAKGKNIRDMGEGRDGGAKGESWGIGKDVVMGKVGMKPN